MRTGRPKYRAQARRVVVREVLRLLVLRSLFLLVCLPRLLSLSRRSCQQLLVLRWMFLCQIGGAPLSISDLGWISSCTVHSNQ